jgi:hypothetical protein
MASDGTGQDDLATLAQGEANTSTGIRPAQLHPGSRPSQFVMPFQRAYRPARGVLPPDTMSQEPRPVNQQRGYILLPDALRSRKRTVLISMFPAVRARPAVCALVTDAVWRPTRRGHASTDRAELPAVRREL